uniref:Ata15 protein n=1 Tax=Saccharothrix mutabilis subsp. capreolus TaxID=66854 RepID=Q83W23_STRMP|nr:Ata15 protein [Saccharothrix mutabilis subsp. capreolus]
MTRLRVDTAADPLERLRAAGMVTLRHSHSGPGPYTPLTGLVSTGPGRPEVGDPGAACLGIDLGATMTRFQLGTAAEGTAIPLVKVRYLTAGTPRAFLDQVSEVVSLARLVGLGAPAAVRVGAAGPVYGGGAPTAVEVTNHPGWVLTDCLARLRERTGCADVHVVNDMAVGLDGPSAASWERDAEPLRSPGGGHGLATGRRLKCQVGTGLNIAMVAADGGVHAFEYGHQPFPALTEQDHALVRALSVLHRRRVVTFEDFLGGRGFGPLLLGYAALTAEPARRSLPPGVRELLDTVSAHAGGDGPGTAATVPEEEIVRAVGEMDARTRELAAWFTGPGPEPSVRDRFARFGLWVLADFLRAGGRPAFAPVLADHGRRLASFVLSAAQVTVCDEVYLGGRLVLDPLVRRGFLDAWDGLAEQFAHGHRLVDRVAVRVFPEPDYELMLLREAAAAVEGARA